MNWLASYQWAIIVKTLLHTIWQGGLIAVLIAAGLRGIKNPVARYRWLLVALFGVIGAGVVTWAVLSRPVSQSKDNLLLVNTTIPAEPATGVTQRPTVVGSNRFEDSPGEIPWTAWLATFWLAGATLMIGRSAVQVVGAERLRRGARRLEDTKVIELLGEVRRTIGLSRRVQIAVTDKLMSPAVMGVLMPTLLLPVSLITTFTPEQIRFVLLHELAHIRRGDYLANLFQMFTEALLFFNPAVWWLSHQLRIEREACCDLFAIDLSGAPAEYARTLLHVAENVRQPSGVPALAFGDERDPSSLADRVKRLLVPGYRPTLRLTWRAMLGALVIGSALLIISAVGTQVTLAAILSPQQRIARIEKRMTELGEKPVSLDGDFNATNRPKVKISGRVRAADGAAVPKWIYLNVHSSLRTSSTGTSVVVKDGVFSGSVAAGIIYVGAQVKDFAPAVVGPLDGISTTRFENLEVVLESGFEVPLQVVDAESAKPLPDASVATMYWIHNNGFQGQSLKSAGDGSMTLVHCADLPLDVTVNVPGYEITQKRFEHLHVNEPIRMSMRRGEIVAGKVVDKITGEPIAGAEFHLLYQTGGEQTGHYEWSDPLRLMTKTERDGTYNLNQFRRGMRYYIGVTAPGHESTILENVTSGKSDLVVRLGPELIVQGRVLGDLKDLQRLDSDYVLTASARETYENNSYGGSQWVRLHTADGVTTFQFTNRMAGLVSLLTQNGKVFERQIDAPVKDWVIDLAGAPTVEATKVSAREVVVKFKHPSGVAPKGTIFMTLPSQMNSAKPDYYRKECEIKDGEVRVESFGGAPLDIEPSHTVGYWFKEIVIGVISNGPGPLVIEVPVTPAGAIYAKARNADGTPAGNLFFGVNEIKRAPGRDESAPLGSGGDSMSGGDPRQWVSGPLPLGGTYQVHGWRGNLFCVSKPVHLTEAVPDAEVELQFPVGRIFEGVVLDTHGRPVRDAELRATFTLSNNNSFGLKSVFTDERGRFQLENMTPEVGVYSVEAKAAGMQADNVKLVFGSRPQEIRLKRGRTLAGRVVEAGTGLAIPGTEVRVVESDHYKLPALMTHTDAEGRFEFTSLGDANYSFYTSDGQLSSGFKHRADGQTNIVLAMKLYEWSQVKPKRKDDHAQ